MSATDFQLALSRLIAAPQLCEQTLVDEAPFFAGFDLTDREQKRLHAVLRQKGMSTCCSLYRMNRITPLYTQLSNTCTLLGEELVPLVEAFWQQLPDTTLQFKDEVLAFGQFLMDRIARGVLQVPYLKEVLQLEMAINELSYLPEGTSRIVQFDHDIIRILLAVTSGTIRSARIDTSDTSYTICMKEGKLEMDVV